jgi:hypothetical protein
MEDKDRMRLSREVRIGELITVIVLLATLAGWYTKISLEPIQAEIRALQVRNDQQDAQSLELKREIRDDLRVLREQVDRLIVLQSQQAQGARR